MSLEVLFIFHWRRSGLLASGVGDETGHCRPSPFFILRVYQPKGWDQLSWGD